MNAKFPASLDKKPSIWYNYLNIVRGALAGNSLVTFFGKGNGRTRKHNCFCTVGSARTTRKDGFLDEIRLL